MHNAALKLPVTAENISKDPSYELHARANLVCIRWTAPATPAALKRVLHQVEQHRETIGTDVTYVAAIFRNEGNPSPELREALPAFFKSLKGSCSSAHVIVEEAGMRGALIRSIATGVTMAIGLRGFLRVHTDVSSLVDSVRKTVDMGEQDILHLLLGK